MYDMSFGGFETQTPHTLGRHLIAEFYGVGRLVDYRPICPVLSRAAHAAGEATMRVEAHDFGLRAGFAAYALLTEGHMSLHTRPDQDCAALDVFVGGRADPLLAMAVLADHLLPGDISYRLIERGASVPLSLT